jgi:D-alanyl-D-alanine dipeptidase
MTLEELNLVDARAFGIKGINFYWTNRERYNISTEELLAAGVKDDGVYIDQDLIEPLKQAEASLTPLGLGLMIKDAYRSPELYQLIYRKRSDMENGNTFLLNLERMPHASGRTVDVTLIDLKTGEELRMRDNSLDADGGFKHGYYAEKDDATHQEYHRLQRILLDVMLEAGFVLGPKEEFWHFELP